MNTYNLPISLADQTLTKVQPLQTDMAIELVAKQCTNVMCINLELHRPSEEAAPLITHVSFTYDTLN